MSRNGQSRPSARPRRRPPVGANLFVESLETRQMLSTTAVAMPAAAVSAITPAWGWGGGFWGGTSEGVTNPTPPAGAFTPAQIQTAYGFSASADTGTGETVAIVDAYNDPNIQSDLATFDTTYKLPTASLTVKNQAGGTTLPATDSGWALEIALDVEWAHAAAPGAKILLVEANSSSTSDLMAAVKTAASQANVVSMSWGGGEFSGESMYDTASYFGKAGVTFVAAAGDSGAASGAEWPSTSPDVVGVGGTSLYLTSSGTYGSEAAWSTSGSRRNGYSGGGGGVSTYESTPSYQTTSATGANYGKRATPDVSSVANPNTGLAVYDSLSTSGQSGWFEVGGTSAGAPVWAGLVADADQARAANGLGSLGSTQTLSLLYGTTASATTYAADFHDVTSGANFAGSAKAGYDLVTGLGTPAANKLIAAASTYGASNAPAAALSSGSGGSGSSTTKVTVHDLVAATTATSTTSMTSQAAVAFAPGASANAASFNTSHLTAAASTAASLAPASALPNQPTTATGSKQATVSIEVGSKIGDIQAVPREATSSPSQAITGASDAVASSASSVSRATWDMACSMLVSEVHPNFTGGLLSMTAPAVDLLDDEGAIPLQVPAVVIGAVAAAWAIGAYRQRNDGEKRLRPLFAWEHPTF